MQLWHLTVLSNAIHSRRRSHHSLPVVRYTLLRPQYGQCRKPILRTFKRPLRTTEYPTEVCSTMLTLVLRFLLLDASLMELRRNSKLAINSHFSQSTLNSDCCCKIASLTMSAVVPVSRRHAMALFQKAAVEKVPAAIQLMPGTLDICHAQRPWYG